MKTATIPSLLTPGRIAERLGAPLTRVTHILATRPHIRPSARAGILRLYDLSAVTMVRHEMNAQDARVLSRDAARRELPHALLPDGSVRFQQEQIEPVIQVVPADQHQDQEVASCKR